MQHADREILDREIIRAVLDMCNVINVGFFDDEYPYVLPFNFGYEYEDDLVFYTHHAVDGYKNHLLQKNQKVCVLAHRFIKGVYNEYDNSHHDYRSVMAFGEMSFVPRDTEEYSNAWDVLTRCNGMTVPEKVFDPDYKVLAGKIVCRKENVIGKAQRSIKSAEQAPFEYFYSDIDDLTHYF
jgi:nitroimidazol reductase NimA-like FMN-containing flavoprotein (pyridoxamine 5'-phosphate oxidase superfamily)